MNLRTPALLPWQAWSIAQPMKAHLGIPDRAEKWQDEVQVLRLMLDRRFRVVVMIAWKDQEGIKHCDFVFKNALIQLGRCVNPAMFLPDQIQHGEI
jgi:hypothetical protein